MGEGTLTWEDLRSGGLVLSRDVAYRSFGEQAVLLHLGSGLYHELNEVGRQVYEALLAGSDLPAAVDDLAGEYDVEVSQVQADVVAFCSELLANGLLIRD